MSCLSLSCGEIALGIRKKQTMRDAEALFPFASQIDLLELRKEAPVVVVIVASRSQTRAQCMPLFVASRSHFTRPQDPGQRVGFASDGRSLKVQQAFGRLAINIRLDDEDLYPSIVDLH